MLKGRQPKLPKLQGTPYGICGVAASTMSGCSHTLSSTVGLVHLSLKELQLVRCTAHHARQLVVDYGALAGAAVAPKEVDLAYPLVIQPAAMRGPIGWQARGITVGPRIAAGCAAGLWHCSGLRWHWQWAALQACGIVVCSSGLAL
jgi:hypothetical protein